MEEEKIKLIVASLIRAKREGEYWDFKQEFHANKASLLHDIICMANNLSDRDGMIIFGVQDKTFDVIGVEGAANRRNLNYYVNFLKDKKFAGGIRPKVEYYTVTVDGKEIDILLVKRTSETPYYLDEDFQDRGKRVRSGLIYTRSGESNTDINRCADVDQVEALWARRLKTVRKLPAFTVYLLDRAEKKTEPPLAYTYSYPGGLLRQRMYNEDDLIDGVTMEEINQYNDALPDLELIQEFNKQQKLYEDVQENSHSVYLHIKNSGAAPGNSIYVTLYLPPEVLVYSRNDCATVEQPAKLDMPEDPIERALNAEYLEHLGIYMKRHPDLEAAIQIGEQYRQLYMIKPLHTLPTLENVDFSINREHNKLEVHIDNLLHTRGYTSDDFYLIITKRGEFEIRYMVMCEEFEEPQEGIFNIIVD